MAGPVGCRGLRHGHVALTPRPGHSGTVAICLSFVVALILTSVPLPAALAAWRPSWVAMTLMFWCLVLPDRIGIGSAWVLGILLDVQGGALLGQNALGLCIIAYLTLRLHKQIRVFPLLQQSVVICFYLLLLEFFTLWVRGITGVPPQHWTFWAPAASSMLLWPLFFATMNAVRHKYKAF